MTYVIEKQKRRKRLKDCPVGLFYCGDTLGMKTEYGNNEGRIDAFIVSSGEFFWGKPPQTIASQREQMVTPCTLRSLPTDDGWEDIATAPRDGTSILAIVAPNDSRHLEYHAGRMFVIRHEGVTDNGYDLGWAVYPGFGGASDHYFAGWRPLPAPPSD